MGPTTKTLDGTYVLSTEDLWSHSERVEKSDRDNPRPPYVVSLSSQPLGKAFEIDEVSSLIPRRCVVWD